MKKLLYTCSALAFISLSSCDKSFDYDKTGSAHLLVAHYSPNGGSVDIKDAPMGNRLYGPAVSFGGVTVGPYLPVPAGNFPISVTAAATTTQVFGATVNIAAGSNTSVIAYDTVNAGAIRALVLNDNLTTPAVGNAHVRLLHLIPNAPAVDVWGFYDKTTVPNASIDSVRLFSNVSYVGNSPNMATLAAFTPTNQLRRYFAVRVRLAGTNTTVINIAPANREALSLGNGKIYTLVARGLVGGTGAQAMAVSTILNN
jgi:hypothetical protein